MSGVAPDGSPVALYARLPALGEAELIHEAVPAGAEILELGAGAGRVTHGLLALGHPVVAVDNSAEMLALVRGAEIVQADIEALDLGRRFPVVVLASNFINHADAARAARAARVVRPPRPAGRPGPAAGLSPRLEAGHGLVGARRRAPPAALATRSRATIVTGEMEYVVDGERLVHPFESKLLSDEELDADLESVGLRRGRELDDAGSWIEAVPLSS